MRIVAMGLVAALALTGCTGKKSEQAAPQPSSVASAVPSVTAVSPSPSPSPSVFESFPPAPADESQDQAAVRAAWMSYWAVYEKFASNPRGYTDFSETQQVTTDEESKLIIETIQELREKNWKSGGNKRFVNVVITITESSNSERSATVSYCMDNTHQIVYGEDGNPLKRNPIHLKEIATLLEVRPGDWRVSMIRNQKTTSC